MMPLALAEQGKENTIVKVDGKPETKKFLESLGFVTGSQVSVVAKQGGNVIVNVKNSRVAIGADMANLIMV
ncbi:MAG: ferrous iron transport protein A [Eubacterium sp.]|nr:ferrous iron transport protein A [Eubacterium sp.]